MYCRFYSFAFQGRRMGLSIFNLTGRLNRLQFIICFIVLMILFHIVHYIDDVFLDFVVSLPAYWFTRVVIWILLASLFPLSCILFGVVFMISALMLGQGFYGR